MLRVGDLDELPQVYVIIVTNPSTGVEEMSAHETLDGARSRIDVMASMWEADRKKLTAEIVKLPILP